MDKKPNPKVCRACVEKRFGHSKKQLDDLERYVFSNEKWTLCAECGYELERTVMNG